ncbi:uncharacterized protein [Miscanthus floridulus]|uniref:uncharacterized protein isoform X1 n=2 Tax=Miscanthus floridulus TaxID=154761 RepID=UPI00345AC29A
MGNICSRRNGGPNDEENAMALSFANAASTGARQAVMDAVQKAQHRGRESGEIVPAEALISGILPTTTAQVAAAEGAKEAIEDRARELNVLSRFASPLKEVKFAASSGAREGLTAAEILFRHDDIEGHARENMSLEVAAAAAGAGAWVSCLVAAQTHLTPAPNASKYTALLGSMLGGSMPTSAALYGLLNASSDLVKLCIFGGITLGVFVISSGLIAGLLGTTNGTVRFTKIATITAVSIVLIFFTVVLCMLFDSDNYKAVCACIFPMLTILFVVAALRYIYHSWR